MRPHSLLARLLVDGRPSSIRRPAIRGDLGWRAEHAIRWTLTRFGALPADGRIRRLDDGAGGVEERLRQASVLSETLTSLAASARIVGAQAVEHHSAQPTFQAPHRFCARVAFGASALVVVPAGTIEAQLDYGDAVDGGIDLPIA